MKKLLSIIAAGLIGLSSANAQIKPTGEIDISYLPSYYGYGLNEPLIKTKLQAGLNFNFTRDLSAYLIGSETTLSEIGSPYINPKMQSYDIGLGVKLYDFEFYLNHDCTHPVGSSPLIVSDSNNSYWLNWSGFTEIGVKYKF